MVSKKDRKPKFLMPKVRGRIPLEEIERAVEKVLAERRAKKAIARTSRGVSRTGR